MKSWDAIVVGAGIIGLSLALELHKKGLTVLVLDKGEPGREASWAAGGMLADGELEVPPVLRDLASTSAGMYPEFVHELQDESGLKIDLRSEGTLVFPDERQRTMLPGDEGAPVLRPATDVAGLEAHFAPVGSEFLLLSERCVDPRDLTAAAIAAARHREIDFSSGDQVLRVETDRDGRTTGVETNKAKFGAGVVINCAGAWAGLIAPQQFPTRPVKGQMLCVAMPEKNFVRHVVRTADVYLIPRSDGRLLIGATQEEAGFDKQTVPETLQKLRLAALQLVPGLREAKILEAWAGLRPGTPDALPILGATKTPGYFVATGHFRDGILLAPVTASVMAEIATNGKATFDLSAFSPERFRA